MAIQADYGTVARLNRAKEAAAVLAVDEFALVGGTNHAGREGQQAAEALVSPQPGDGQTVFLTTQIVVALSLIHI